MYIHSETVPRRADSNCPCNQRSWCGTKHHSHHTEPDTDSKLPTSTNVNGSALELNLHVHCVSKNVYNPTTNGNFNNSCPISVTFGTTITERVCYLKVDISHLTCSMYTPYLGKLQEPENHNVSSKGTSFFRIDQVIYTLYDHDSFLSYEKLTISAQNVVHLHTRMLSVALSTCQWLHQ